MLADMRARGERFCSLGLRLSKEHARHFRARPLDSTRQLHYGALASQSVERQREIEASDRIGFDAYLSRYFAQA
jgi:glutamate--cysteine ligase